MFEVFLISHMTYYFLCLKEEVLIREYKYTDIDENRKHDVEKKRGMSVVFLTEITYYKCSTSSNNIPIPVMISEEGKRKLRCVYTHDVERYP